MPIGRTKKTGNYVKSGDRAIMPATAAEIAAIQPRTIMKSADSGLYYFVGDPPSPGNGVLFPLVGLNPIASPASNGVYLRKIADGTNIATDVGGGVFQIRLRAKVVSPTTLLTFSAAGRILIDVGPNATVIAATKGSVNAPSLGAGIGVVFAAHVDPTDGQIDLLITFAAGGSKRIGLSIGPDNYSFTITAT